MQRQPLRKGDPQGNNVSANQSISRDESCSSDSYPKAPSWFYYNVIKQIVCSESDIIKKSVSLDRSFD